MSVLEMRRVSRAYGQGAAEVHALKEVSLRVDAGSMVAVMGPSGSGKSTLLTIAGSLEEPSSGEVLVCGEELSKLSGNARASLDELGLSDRAEHFPDQLSGGERQRASIARAVVGEHQLLLADEPSGALDSVNGEAVMRLIRAACKRGLAAVVVTHDAKLASWADRVMFLRDGRVTDQTAPPAGPESLLARGAGQ